MEFQFTIPSHPSELLNTGQNNYIVSQQYDAKEIPELLSKAKNAFCSDGIFYIFGHFDTFFAVFNETATQLAAVHCIRANSLLYLSIDSLGKYLSTLFEGESLSLEQRTEALNATKMLVYLIINTIKKIDKNVKTILNTRIVKKGARKADAPEDYVSWDEKRTQCLIQLYNFVKLPLEKLWDPPVVEENFVNLFCDITYRTLEHPTIKISNVINTVFQILGYAIKRYNHGLSFPLHIIQIIESCESSISPIVNGIKILYDEFGITQIFTALMENLVDKLSADETDSQKSKYFSHFLTEMTAVAPNLILPHILTLSENLINSDSYVLRNCALQLMGNALVDNLTSENLTNEMKELRDDFLEYLLENMMDISAHVRSKDCQIWKLLQSQNAIPLLWQPKVLVAAYDRLDDKASLVRKNAIALIRAYLEHNPFGATFSLEELRTRTAEEEAKLEALRDKKKENIELCEKYIMEWETNLEENAKTALENFLQTTTNEYPSIPGEAGEEKYNEIVSAVIALMKEEEVNWTVIITLTQEADDTIDNRKDRIHLPPGAEVCYFLTILKKFYLISRDIPDYDTEMGKIEKTIQFFNNYTEFSETIFKCLKKMESFLMSKTNSDVAEAVDFFTTSYLFGIEDTKFGVRRMLRLVWSNETVKRELVAEAYKRILFGEEKPKAADDRLYNVKTVRKLLTFLIDLDHSEYMAIKVLFAEWIKNGIITNSMINVMFEIYTMKIENVSEKESTLAQQLLILCSVENPSIVSANKDLLIKIGFEERGPVRPSIFIGTQQLLQHQLIQTSSTQYYKRLELDNEMVQSIKNIYINFFFDSKLSTQFDNITRSTFEFIYRMCQQPDTISTELIINLFDRINTIAVSLAATAKPAEPSPIDDRRNSFGEIPSSQISQGLPASQLPPAMIDELQCVPVPLLSKFVFLLGYVATKQLIYLDISVYSNLKYRAELKANKQLLKKNANLQNKRLTLLRKSLNSSASHALKRRSELPAHPENETEEDIFGVGDDDIAEQIQLINENEILFDPDSMLYTFVPLIKDLCSKQKKHNSDELSQAAVLTLIRFMTISSRFCDSNLPFLMNIFRETNNITIKCNIVIGLSDFTFRFPNVLEPWTSHFYNTLKSSNIELRLTAIKILSNLILNEMIRVRGQISDMAKCLVDEDFQIRSTTEQFFVEIANKASILYNALPDIISTLSNPPHIDQDKYQIIMKYLMALIQKDRQVEALVEKLCSRLRTSLDERQWCDWTFCLSLLHYNEKTIKKLIEHIDCFKDKVQVDEVYDALKLIISNTNKLAKPELKVIVKEFETRLAECLAVNEENAEDGPTQNRTQSAEERNSRKNSKGNKKRAPPPRNIKGQKNRKNTSSSSESGNESKESDSDFENQPPPPQSFKTPAVKATAPRTAASRTPAPARTSVRTPAATRTSTRTPATTQRSARKNTVAKNVIVDSNSSSDETERPQPKKGRNKRS